MISSLLVIAITNIPHTCKNYIVPVLSSVMLPALTFARVGVDILVPGLERNAWSYILTSVRHLDLDLLQGSEVCLVDTSIGLQ